MAIDRILVELECVQHFQLYICNILLLLFGRFRYFAEHNLKFSHHAIFVIIFKAFRGEFVGTFIANFHIELHTSSTIFYFLFTGSTALVGSGPFFQFHDHFTSW